MYRHVKLYNNVHIKHRWMCLYIDTHTLPTMMGTPPSPGTLPQLSDRSPACTLSLYWFVPLILSRLKASPIFNKQTNNWGVPWQPSSEDSGLSLPWPRFSPWLGNWDPISYATNRQTVPSQSDSVSSPLGDGHRANYSLMSFLTLFRWLLSGFCPSHFRETAHAKVTHDLWLPNPVEFFSSYLACPFWISHITATQFFLKHSLGFLQCFSLLVFLLTPWSVFFRVRHGLPPQTLM